ncbi:MAG TPA: YhcH/YjgK/YiaL family protein [Vicinamibacterales bacterium]|nr:YhcH/YjgK/YiaL family protein [Vicinamibacterales bacterium]
MILDTLEHAPRYAHLHPLFARAFEFLRTAALESMLQGRHEIDGDRLFVSIDHVNGRGRDGARVEAHRRYIDIQVAFDGTDDIGWLPLAACRSVDEPFDETRDVAFWKDRPDTWVALPPGRFAVFFPDDAHAPLGGHGPVRKAIFKIRAIGR